MGALPAPLAGRTVSPRFRLASLGGLKGAIQGSSSMDSFRSMHLDEKLHKAVEEMHVTKPSAIQSIAIPRLLSIYKRGPGENGVKKTLVSAETGAGKTLSYLLPLAHQLKSEEAGGGLAGEAGAVGLRSAILVPTNELVDQVHSVAKSIGHCAKLVVEKAGCRQLKRHAKRRVDIIVGTPKRLLSTGGLGALSHLVIDEADTLLCDMSFSRQIRKIEELCAGSLKSCVCCSATITEALRRRLSDPESAVFITTANLHRPPDGRIRHTLRLVKQPEDGRFAAIARLIRPAEKTLIFCNSAASAIRLYNSLQISINPVLVHGGIPETQRAALLAAFKSDGSQCNVMVATDLMARGIDICNVAHVVMNGCPQSLVDYLHRMGRVGRVGSIVSGRVTTVVSSRQLPIVRRFMQSISNNERINK